TFRVDRLRLRTPNGPRFTPREPPSPDLGRYISERITAAPYRYHGRFTVQAPAEAIAARMPPTMAVVEPAGEDVCVLTTGSNSLDELAMWVAQLGVPFETHEPPELLEHLHTLGTRLINATTRLADPSVTPGLPAGQALRP
ncbi:WYL domain-containing protein, partial [Actinomadura adrarensis]